MDSSPRPLRLPFWNHFAGYELWVVASSSGHRSVVSCVLEEDWAGRPETERALSRRGDSRSLPVVCDCGSNLAPAGLEPAGAAIADHPLTSDGSLDQPPDTTKHRSLLIEGCCAFFLRRFFPGETWGGAIASTPGPSEDPGCFG